MTAPGTVSITSRQISDFRTYPANAVARYYLYNDGLAKGYKSNFGYINYSGEWKLSGAAADYDVRFTSSSGDSPTGGATLGVWHNLGSTRYVEMLRSTFGIYSGVVLVEIRPAGGGANLDSASITLEAEKENNQ